MSDLRDPHESERWEAEAPDAYLRRREFLQRTAMTAGLAATAGTVLSSDALVAEAARRQRRHRLPSPRNMPVDTIVVLMMENRSFDHLVGWLPGADGRQAGLRYRDKQGHVHATRPLAPDWQGCSYADPDHSWEGGRIQYDHGRCDGFLRSGDNDVFSISYYREHDLPFIPHAAKTFTTFDRFHCSLMGSTLPNREYMHAAQSYGLRDNSFPPQKGYPSGFPDTTIFAALDRKGVSNRYFYNDVPVTALWGPPAAKRSGQVQEFYELAALGQLPHVSYVDPNFGGSIGEGPGISGDEHPHGDIRTGEAFVSDVVHAFMESPQWKRGALFIIYDEWGGFFDHVRPPRVPDIRNNRNIDEDYGLMGFRIPAVAVSPWVRRGHVAHSIYGFESILKMIEYRFGVGPLTRRDAYASNIARSFEWEHKPRFDVPTLPRPEHVVSKPCPGEKRLAADGARPQPHPLVELAESGGLEPLGFNYRPGSVASTFREPSKVASSFA
jgi:phospholipase C